MEKNDLQLCGALKLEHAQKRGHIELDPVIYKGTYLVLSKK